MFLLENCHVHKYLATVKNNFKKTRWQKWKTAKSDSRKTAPQAFVVCTHHKRRNRVGHQRNQRQEATSPVLIEYHSWSSCDLSSIGYIREGVRCIPGGQYHERSKADASSRQDPPASTKPNPFRLTFHNHQHRFRVSLEKAHNL